MKRVFLRQAPLLPVGGSIHLGTVMLLMLAAALPIGGVHQLMSWYEVSQGTRDVIVAVVFFMGLLGVGAVVFVRWRRRAIAEITFSEESFEVSGYGVRSVAFEELATVQARYSPELESLSLVTRDRATFVFEHGPWELQAIVRELEERTIPRMADVARRQLAEGAVVSFSQPRLWSLGRALLGIALAPLVIGHFELFVPGLGRRVGKMLTTAHILPHRGVALSATGLRRSGLDLRDVVLWEDVTGVRADARSVSVDAGARRFWLSRSAANHLVFVELVRGFAPPDPKRPWTA